MRVMERHLGISLALIIVTTFSSTVVAGQGASSTKPFGDWSAINLVPSGDKLLVNTAALGIDGYLPNQRLSRMRSPDGIA